MKRLLSVLIMMVFLVQLSGCGIYEIMTENDTKIDKMSEEIIRCLIEKDRDALEALFCQRVRSTAEFEAQIDSLYDYFDFDHYIGYDLDGAEAQSEHTEDGERVEWLVRAEIVYIEVCNEDEDTTWFYGIEYDWAETYQQDASLVGLHSVRIYLLNSDEIKTVGTDQYFPF